MTYPVSSFPNTAHSVFYAYTLSSNNGTPIGTFEKFGSNFTRTHERIREIFFPRGPQTKEIIWGGTDISITITQVELYDKAIFEVFGVEVYSIEDFNQTIDILEIMHKPGASLASIEPDPISADSADGGIDTAFSRRIITYHDCVPTNVTKDIDTGSAKVAINMTFECRTVSGEVQ